jgi:adenylate cyclase
MGSCQKKPTQKSAFDCKTFEEILPKYVCHKCVDKLLEYNRKGTFGGEIMYMTIMFVDIHGFSAIAEKLGPEEAMAVLNTNFHVMIETIFDCKGALLKFIGDGMMAAFGLPRPEEDDLERSLNCAIQLQQEIRELQKTQDDIKRIKIGIGMHTGDVVLGNVGNNKRLDFTIIGDAVNIAARLADMARANEILATEDTVSSLQENKYDTVFVEDFLPRGKTRKINYYRVRW